MKNTLKLFGFIALVAIIGFSMAACDPGGSDDVLSDDDPIELTEEQEGLKAHILEMWAEFDADKRVAFNNALRIFGLPQILHHGVIQPG